MCDKTSSNPFAALFSPIEIVQSSEESAAPEAFVSAKDEHCSKSAIEEELLAEVFGLTLKSKPDARRKECLVYVEADTAEEAIFDRLTLEDFKPRLVRGCEKAVLDDHTTEKKIMLYLFESFRRLRKRRRTKQPAGSEETRENLEKVTLRNVSTVLQVPDFFPGQKVHEQFVSLFEDGAATSEETTFFVSGVLEELEAAAGRDSDDEIVAAAITPLLDSVREEATSRNLFTACRSWFNLLQKFTCFETLAKLIIRHSTPSGDSGRAYMDTLLGTLFSFTCLPDEVSDTLVNLFDGTLEQRKPAFEGAVWSALDTLGDSLHRVFHGLLKCSPEVRHLTLKWLGDCLKANASRGKLWNTQNLAIPNTSTVSDGFMLNLCSLLLRLCQPFSAKNKDPRVLQIDPTYCAAEAKDEEESRNRGLHMHGMSKETCLVPTAEGETRKTSDSFGFVTECFFLTHHALDLGYRIVFEKLTRANHELLVVVRMIGEVRNTNGEQLALNLMDKEFMKYMSVHASLHAPDTLNLLAKFHATTAHWLVQVNLDLDNGESSAEETSIPRKDYTLRKERTVTFPLPDTVPDTVKCIPEFVVENMIEFVCFLTRSSPDVFEKQRSSFLGLILTEILVLMGSPERLYNPHLRARLAKALQALSPSNDDNEIHPQATLGTLNRKLLFTEHEHRHQIVPTLLHVFVSIEMTGQSVQFEQKFNYRRPMNVILDYLLGIREHKDIVKKLADEAEANMEAVQPPLFLRFVNLLMNDAVFLLEDALTNMAQLRQMIQAREGGEWERMPRDERNQQTAHFQRIGMIARFDNILGRETIHTLKMLTKDIKSVFCHPTMVDRMASMLNYLLLQLVGPKKRNLKVKDRKEYEFEPATLVLNICEIYINLSENENFTLAVSQDGRSYTSNLFDLAEDVLVRIGGGGILSDLAIFAKRVKAAANVKKEEDELLNKAPDDFLDPIMSTLMLDPVVLPSSNVTVDRQTIARHLLSDQTDPFNRSPLTMDMVKSNTELRTQIEEWIQQRKGEKSSPSNSETDQ